MDEYPKKLAPGVMVVGRFDPGSDPITISLVDSGIRDQVQNIPIPPYSDIRPPDENQRMKMHDIAGNWHRDINYSFEDLAMIVWSNREQTEIQLMDGTVIQPDPCDIVMIHNDKVLHRTPQKMSDDRWFFRSHLVAPEWL